MFGRLVVGPFDPPLLFLGPQLGGGEFDRSRASFLIPQFKLWQFPAGRLVGAHGVEPGSFDPMEFVGGFFGFVQPEGPLEL